MHLCHYTLTTGDLRRSPRSEVGDDILPMLAPMLQPGTYPMPGMSVLYSVQTSLPDADTLAATVLRDRTPIAVMTVVRTPVALQAALGRLRVQPGADLWSPACLVDVLPGFRADESWVADFERCLAWAWVLHGRRA